MKQLNRKKWIIALVCLGVAVACFGTAGASSQDPKPEVTEPPEIIETITEPPYLEEELEILALIIYQEAGADYCLDSTRQMVGEVFLNRVMSPYFPDTFYEVAVEEAQYGCLYWTGLVWPERVVLPQEQHAIERAYAVAKDLLTNSVERLLPQDVIYQAEFEQGSEVVAVQDGFYFCR